MRIELARRPNEQGHNDAGHEARAEGDCQRFRWTGTNDVFGLLVALLELLLHVVVSLSERFTRLVGILRRIFTSLTGVLTGLICVVTRGIGCAVGHVATVFHSLVKKRFDIATCRTRFLLNHANELLDVAFTLREVIVRQLPPSLLDSTLQLIPSALQFLLGNHLSSPFFGMRVSNQFDSMSTIPECNCRARSQNLPRFLRIPEFQLERAIWRWLITNQLVFVSIDHASTCDQLLKSEALCLRVVDSFTGWHGVCFSFQHDPSCGPLSQGLRFMSDAEVLDIAKHVEAQICDRTSRRVHELHVHPSNGKLSISGRVHTFHIKQLALNAAMETLGNRHLVAHFDIKVVNNAAAVTH